MSEHPTRASLARRLWEAILMVTLWRIGALRRRRRRVEPQESDPWRRETGASEWAQLVVPAMLGLCALSGLGFVALFVLDPNTQLLALCLGAALALLAGSLILAGRFLVAQETKVEQRPMYGDRQASEEVAEQLVRGLDGITRRRLLGGAASIAGAGIAAAVVIPVVALGPGIEEQLSKTPWRAGRALVDEEGNPILAADVREGSFLTAFPEGGEQDNLGSPVVVVRVDPSTLALPAERASWAPETACRLSAVTATSQSKCRKISRRSKCSKSRSASASTIAAFFPPISH